MIEVFKITHNIHDTTVAPDRVFNERANTRGNHYKLQNHSFHYDLRKHFFLHALKISGTACLIQSLMLALLIRLKHA